METIDAGCTKPTTHYAYTDIVNFQTSIMGNALTQVTAPYKQYGYSYLADTDEAYKTRSGTKPPEFPDMPEPPGLTDKISIRKANRELKH